MSGPRLVRGILLGGEFDKLVIQATAHDVAVFGSPGAAVCVSDGPSAGVVDWRDLMGAGGFLYDRHGHQVAIIEQIQQHRSVVDVTPTGSSFSQVIGGLREVSIRARGL